MRILVPTPDSTPVQPPFHTLTLGQCRLKQGSHQIRDGFFVVVVVPIGDFFLFRFHKNNNKETNFPNPGHAHLCLGLGQTRTLLFSRFFYMD